jgi:hypothetical protein
LEIARWPTVVKIEFLNLNTLMFSELPRVLRAMIPDENKPRTSNKNLHKERTNRYGLEDFTQQNEAPLIFP